MRKPKGDTTAKPDGVEDGFDRRSILLGGASAMALSMLAGPSAKAETAAGAQPAPTPASGSKPNILVIWGDDIGQGNISAFTKGLMGYRTPNIDRVANEGMIFTDYYGEQSCTAGRSSFITGQSVFRTGLSKVGLPGADLGLRAEDPTIATLLKPLGYATGQFGKNHLGDKNEFLPTLHGFDEFLGNLYHLNAEEEPENEDYPKDPAFRAKFGPRGVLHTFATDSTIKPSSPVSRATSSSVRAMRARCAMWDTTAGVISEPVISELRGTPEVYEAAIPRSARGDQRAADFARPPSEVTNDAWSRAISARLRCEVVPGAK
jgi:arylsulfatase